MNGKYRKVHSHQKTIRSSRIIEYPGDDNPKQINCEPNVSLEICKAYEKNSHDQVPHLAYIDDPLAIPQKMKCYGYIV